jgi:hypothetical protein
MLFLLACQNIGKLPITNDVYQEDSAEDSSVDTQRYVMTTMLYQNKRGRLFVYDRETNQEVWRLENENDPVWQDARLNLDGTAILHNECDVVDHDFGKAFLTMISPSGEEITRVTAPASHHSVDIIDENRWATIEYEVRNTESYGDVAGDTIVLYQDGQREEVLSTFDVLYPSPVTEMWEHGFFPNAHDWTHANAIRWNEEQQELLVTIPGLNALWSVGLDGLVRRVYLGQFTSRELYEQGPMYQNNPYEIIEGGTFDMPHGASIDSAGRLWVMSNGLGPEAESSAQGYEVLGGELQLIRTINVPIEGARTAGLGSVTFLEKTETVLVNWGILGILEEVNDQNQSIWQIQTDIGDVLGMSTTSPNFPR